MRMHNKFLVLTAALAFAAASTACGNTAEGVKKDAAEAKVETADERAKAAAAGREAGAEVKDATRDAGRAIDAASETLDVKKALMADSTVDASNINVDTFHETKSVVLKGHVPNAAMKAEAGRIAMKEATGYKVDNQLMVRP